jgi:hypothetical protein
MRALTSEVSMMTIRRSICDAALCRECRGVLGRIVALVLLIGTTLPAAGQIDPRAPGAIALPELGRLTGSLKCVTAVLERFGRQIYAVGDVDGDSLNDWVLTHRRCDTSFSNGNAVIELLIYHGVRGGLPPASAGIRLGPSEIDADCSFIGAGDYDGDGHRDIAISQRILSDPFTRRVSVSSVVVYWNDRSGRFSVDDMTHLTAPNQRISIMTQPDYERTARVPERCDIDRDGAEDLVVITDGVEVIDMVNVPCPLVLIYRGHRGSRWGRNGVPARPDWQFWRRLFTRRVSVLDHDGDGALDIVMHVDNDDIGQRGGVSVLYGVRGGLPDTTQLEHVDYVRRAGFDGKRCEYIDLTGDLVPELVLTAAGMEDGLAPHWLIYVGRRGQRLLEQYGSGDDAPRPGDSLWWGRPWTIVQTAYSLNRSWMPPFDAVLDPGDIGLDGVGDFCATSYPGIVCYNGGSRLDSWIDAGAAVWPADPDRGILARLGDVDGSKRAAIGVSDDGGVAVFYRSDLGVPRGGDSLRLPEGSDRPVSAALTANALAPLAVTLAPNPSSSSTWLRWSSLGGPTQVVLRDLRGRDMRRWSLPPGLGELRINVDGMPSGVYLIHVISGERSVTLPLMLTE